MGLSKTVYLALGSNLGDRRANLDRAVELLDQAGVHVLRRSSIFDTAPRYLADQPRFFNQVIECETTVFPRQLLSVTRGIEKTMGRKPTAPNGPRLIDIDILLFAKAVIELPGLVIPHPRIAERRFVLEPLAELVPTLRHPVTRRTVKEMLADVMDQSVRKAPLE